MANDTGRTLIYASRKHNDGLLSFLGEQGWQVLPAKSASDVSRILNPGTTSAALIDLASGYSDREMGAFESCMQPATVGWVAATNPEQLTTKAIRRLIRDYCFDYVNVPCTNDQLAHSIGHAWGMASLSEVPFVTPQVGGDQEMVGTCEAMQQLFRTIRKVANTEAPVFISGESGTGKELSAVAIHERSSRAKGPFVAINMAAIPRDLIESELFGHEKGAFTGAQARSAGRFEQAEGGTLFLDEIGDMPMEAQTRLLRVLQQGEYTTVGGRTPIRTDVRIVAATNKDLRTLINQGLFREDLFYRLNVVPLRLPGLRERAEDIPDLVRHFFKQGEKEGLQAKRIAAGGWS